jgi:hypothetical protein
VRWWTGLDTGERERMCSLAARELDALEGALGQLAVGEPWMVEVVGEPGIGKSRRLSELGSRTVRRDYLVLGGRAAEFEQDVPFGLIVEALNDYLGSLESSFLRVLDEPTSGSSRRSSQLCRALRPSLAPHAVAVIATARTMRYGHCSSVCRHGSRWCSSSTTCTVQTAHRSRSLLTSPDVSAARCSPGLPSDRRPRGWHRRFRPPLAADSEAASSWRH